MKRSLNQRTIGLSISLLLPIIGLFGINQFRFESLDFSSFITQAWELQSLGTWLKPAVLLNLLPFILFVNTNRLKSAQGVVFGTILYALFIAYLIFLF